MKITEQENPNLPQLREKTLKLTTSAGCYIMKNKNGDIIYIGKAKNLKNRVSSYFRAGQNHLPKVYQMVSHVYDYDFICTDSEFEALVLECSLIKQHKPKYNILLKDDKGYSYIKVTNEDYPRISAVMQQEKDNSEYIGPYTSSFAVRQAVEEAIKVFKLPTCRKKFPQDFKKSRPCLNYHIGLCMGVCCGNISQQDYNQNIKNAVDYIKDGSKSSVKSLTQQMQKASEELNFELAIQLRDKISAIEKVTESQKIIDEDIADCDIFAVVANAEKAIASLLVYRNGRLCDKADFDIGQPDEPILMREQLLVQYYADKTPPGNIFTDFEVSDTLKQFLREKRKKSLNISCPKRGEMLKLVQMAQKNASEYLSIKTENSKGKELLALDRLAKLLGLKKPPEIIECYDISNFGNENIVAGMVVYKNGRPCKKMYKRFSIKTVKTQDDYACMREVITRRFENYKNQTDEGFSVLPDLIFLDGGQGHVNTVAPLLEEMGISVPLFGLVKDSRHRTRAIAAGTGEISVSQDRPAFNLITNIQDEVHRFAVSYLKKAHKKGQFSMTLTQVEGIGEKRAIKLMTHFKTTENLKSATLQELAKAAGISEKNAEQLYNFIQKL